MKENGWVYANELFDGITNKVNVGQKIIEGATHIEKVPELVQRTREVYETVENARVMRALELYNKLHPINNAIGKADTLYTAEEVLRPTRSENKDDRNKSRKYDYDDSEFYL